MQVFSGGLSVGQRIAVTEGACLLALADELSRRLGLSGVALVKRLSQAHREWDYQPSDRSGAEATGLHRWGWHTYHANKTTDNQYHLHTVTPAVTFNRCCRAMRPSESTWLPAC